MRPSSWQVGSQARAQLAAANEREASGSRRALLRGHAERWLGRRLLPRDPTLLRAIARGAGWVRLEALCTLPKMRLLKATPGEVAAALRGSRVVELTPARPPPQLQLHSLRDSVGGSGSLCISSGTVADSSGGDAGSDRAGGGTQQVRASVAEMNRGAIDWHARPAGVSLRQLLAYLREVA